MNVTKLTQFTEGVYFFVLYYVYFRFTENHMFLGVFNIQFFYYSPLTEYFPPELNDK